MIAPLLILVVFLILSLLILLSSGAKELRMSGTLAKLKVEEAAKQ